ncbi:MAG TPA: TRAP transporter small permease [Rubrobacteraceae bacterium]|jgi:TRAP-type C4-dicarboxylate transport system permease small subunit|nr:TRAP transporter small permease [Rubrobacteraceae bacterium]
MTRILGKSLDRIEDIFAFLGGILLVVAVFSVVFQVIARYFFGLSFIWINEVNEYILLYVPFLGAAWLLRHNGHVTVDLLVRVLPPRIKKASNILVAALGIIISAVLVWYGTSVTMEAYARGTVSTTSTQLPLVYLLVVIPVGSLLLLFEFIRKAFNSGTGAEPDEYDRPLAE